MAEIQKPQFASSDKEKQSPSERAATLMFLATTFIALWIMGGVTGYMTTPSPVGDSPILGLCCVIWTGQAMLAGFALGTLPNRPPNLEEFHYYCGALIGGMLMLIFGTVCADIGNGACVGFWVTTGSVVGVALEVKFKRCAAIRMKLDEWLENTEREQKS
ncbi:hypothetical protein CKM354_000618400 [Cercospora kikuchii]|uniref:Uncharacterized protein n=1 Tax=Cercospora kikuchii TaxID=84275 RepID=A0A9P3CK96_9PEZI|nr:uncharacterized protein CKM354_000618400 [Cercospora kikuchii]GIZ42937.1 hypothetical protein CKM354_000618400 [Cercospora kikuchii]